MSLDKERQPDTIVDMDAAEASSAYANSADRFFEKADNFDFAGKVLSKVLENVESGAKILLSEEELVSFIAQAASLETIVDAVSDAKDEVAEAAESHIRMGHDSYGMSRLLQA